MKELTLTQLETKLLFWMAFRYALGRSTYIVNDMIRLIKINWGNMRGDEQAKFKQEINQAIDRGHAGMEIDVIEWRKILEL